MSQRVGRGGVGSEELGGVLTRAVQSNITAVGTTPANIAAMEIPSVFSNLLLPLPPTPSSIIARSSRATPFFQRKTPDRPAFLAAARSNILLPPEEI